MPKYSRKIKNPETTVKARINSATCSFKNTCETIRMVKGLTLPQAETYLHKVINKEDIVPFRRFNGGVGRQSQAKKYGISQGRWPKKSCEYVLKLLANVATNIEAQGLDRNRMIVTHALAQQAKKRHRRRFRAHGRISPFNGKPCHIEVILEEKKDKVEELGGKRMQLRDFENKIVLRNELKSGMSAYGDMRE